VKILFLKKIFCQKDASRIKEEGEKRGEMYRLLSSNLIRKGLARARLFVLSLRYCYTLLVLRSPARRDAGWMLYVPR
jgi:hypothetical protein